MNDALFDMMTVYGRPIDKDASARNAIGDVAEEFACAALGMKRLKVNGSLKVCSDAEWQGSPVEIKSVGKNGRALLYKWRAEKELDSIGRGYTYLFVRHTCPIKVAHGRDITSHFAEHPPSLLITNLGVIMDVLKGTPPRKFKLHDGKTYENKYGRPAGFERKGYIDGGWQFALSMIREAAAFEVEVSWLNSTVKCRVAVSKNCTPCKQFLLQRFAPVPVSNPMKKKKKTK
jgi:hypothetical protein